LPLDHRVRRAAGLVCARWAASGPAHRGNRPYAPPATRGHRGTHWPHERLRGALCVEAPTMLGRGPPAQEQRRAARGDGRPGGRSVRGEVIGCSILLGLLLGGASIVGIADATERCTDCVTAGASYVALRVPPGTPLAGYGGMQRRLVFPDVFDRYAHAFWFRPSVGEHDSVAARALVLESRAARLACVTVDLIA